MKKTIAFLGASGGLGKKVCDLLKQEDGYTLIPLDSKRLDITNSEQVRKFFNENDIDIVINFAAFNHDSFLHKYDSSSEQQLEQQIKVNVNGSVNILSSCLKKMRKNKYGRVIFISSIVAENPMFGTSIYSSSKSFIETLCKAASIENANQNISVNTIRLGYFDGGLLYKIDEKDREIIKEKIPMKRWGTHEELFSAIKYLLETPYANGSCVKLTGGL
jgi:acetoacetyl-CoA reductase